ncbi:biopolymer transporter ExbD [Candidatus Liberibacter sp.]|uniref:ExbD/TolR family protein n=1 Tax=Candidatus Liberibacter sp. TaxID=34022 RepID=UPI0015F550AB|nr:biopolymer transporter ExbD [Candidatus Liberibacter sp.]MBA5723555.1 biopolymer transporter ExbD [Candidatus Liberibacter sp.]
MGNAENRVSLERVRSSRCRRSSKLFDGPVNNQISMTPLIDVMLVLLIVFMVTSPMVTDGISIDLPKTEAVDRLDMQMQPIIITVKADGTTFVQETQASLDDIVQKLRFLGDSDFGKRIFIRGDAYTPYGMMADVMSRIQGSGYKNIGLVIQKIKAD